MPRFRPAHWVWLLRLSRSGRNGPFARWRARAVWLGLAWLGVLLAAGSVGVSAGYAYLTHDQPAVALLETWLDPKTGLFWHPTRIYAADGSLWFPRPEDTRAAPYVPLGQIPDPVLQTTLAALDPNFWEHGGVEGPWWRLQGRRTLAQRLVSRFLLAGRPSDARTSWQARLLAVQATARYGRGQMLEWYLNSAPYGPDVYGIADAARAYFGKSPDELSWFEAAWLAVAARAYPQDPRQGAEDWAAQAQALLRDMAEDGLAPASSIQAPAPQPRPSNTTAPLAAQAVFDALRRALPAWPAATRGLTVQSTLEPDLMRQAACLVPGVAELTPPSPEHCPAAAKLQLYRLQTGLPQATFHLVALDPETGAVLAWYTRPSQTQGDVPVGSLVAPWVYAVAFSRGWGPASLMWDLPERAPLGLTIRNHDGQFHGPLRARIALANAYEVPLADLLAQLDPRTVWPTVQRLGLREWPATATWEPLQAQTRLSPVTVAHGLSPLATLGRQSGLPQPNAPALLPRWWRTIRRGDGATLPEEPVPETRALLEPGLAYLVDHVLSDAPAHRPTIGPGDPLADVEPAAVALGRTPDGRVAWVAVWSPERVAVVAVDARAGHAEPQTVTQAARVLARAWWQAVQPAPPPPWPRPPEVVQIPVCDPSGLLPTEDCPNVVLELFLRDQVPTQTDPYYRRLKIHRPTGLLATIFTPPREIEERVFFMWPPEAREWAQEQGLPVPPQTYAPIHPPLPEPDLHLSRPEMFAHVRGVVSLQGVVATPGARSYRVQVGQGPYPEEWVTVAQGAAPAKGALGRWDTRGLEGLYTLQLMAVDADARVRTSTIQVTVDARPPRITVHTPQDGGRYCPIAPCDDEGGATSIKAKAFPIDIRAEDDLALEEVRAWMDGRLLARWAKPPFVLAWPPKPGAHTLRVEARDRAGNRTTTTLTFTVEEHP